MRKRATDEDSFSVPSSLRPALSVAHHSFCVPMSPQEAPPPSGSGGGASCAAEGGIGVGRQHSGLTGESGAEARPIEHIVGYVSRLPRAPTGSSLT